MIFQGAMKTLVHKLDKYHSFFRQVPVSEQGGVSHFTLLPQHVGSEEFAFIREGAEKSLVICLLSH